jgi:glucose-1-phosphate thymidylyltransferase
VVNKHILPIYDEPMIFYPVRTLITAGVDELLVISNAEHIGKYIQLLENSRFDASFSYRVQSESKGIAHAVRLAESFVDGDFAVMLGDNIVLDDLSEAFDSFTESASDARVFLTQVDEPSAYGVATVRDGRVAGIEEKPSLPASDYAVIGLYLYTPEVFDLIAELKPSERGELEITHVNNRYATEDSLDYQEYEGEWFDAGTPEGVFRASKYVRNRRDD